MVEAPRNVCTFCGADQGERAVLIRSPGDGGAAYICERCVVTCMLVIADHTRRLVMPLEEPSVCEADDDER